MLETVDVHHQSVNEPRRVPAHTRVLPNRGDILETGDHEIQNANQ